MKTQYKLHTYTKTGAKTIHTFDTFKDAQQLQNEQSYFRSEITIHRDAVKVVDPSIDERAKKYLERMKDCFGFYARNAAQDIDSLAQSLIEDGFTHIQNLFGPIEIKTDWLGFTTRQNAAKCGSFNS